MATGRGLQCLVFTMAAGASCGRSGLLGRLSEDSKCSRSTLRSLALLNAFPEVGRGAGYSGRSRRSRALTEHTTHHYLSTWVIVGAVAQDPVSRQYRRRVDDGSGD
jgi:hypothetical protein